MFRYIVSFFVLITLEKNLKRRGRKGGKRFAFKRTLYSSVVIKVIPCL